MRSRKFATEIVDLSGVIVIHIRRLPRACVIFVLRGALAAHGVEVGEIAQRLHQYRHGARVALVFGRIGRSREPRFQLFHARIGGEPQPVNDTGAVGSKRHL